MLGYFWCRQSFCYTWYRHFSGCRRRQTDGLLQPGVVCVGITGNEPRRHRWVQHSCSSHQSVRPSGDSYHQTLCSLQRTDNIIIFTRRL